MTPYISVYDATTYFLTRFNSSLWATTSAANQLAALVTATRLIDTLNYAGDKADPDQELEFPRGDDTAIPEAIKLACCEIAYQLLNGYDPEYEMRNVSEGNLSFDTSRIGTDTKSMHEAKAHGIPSIVAWDYLRPFLRDPSQITLSRVD